MLTSHPSVVYVAQLNLISHSYLLSRYQIDGGDMRQKIFTYQRAIGSTGSVLLCMGRNPAHGPEAKSHDWLVCGECLILG